MYECASFSTNDIVANELHKEESINPIDPSSSGSGAAASLSNNKRRPKNKQLQPLQGQKLYKKRASNIVAETVWTKFKNQLTSLMERLGETQTRYIRCIKPNSQRKPLLMEHTSTIEQLRCAGVVAAVTISRSAFPNRLEHVVVLERFKNMKPKGDHFTVLKDMSLDILERQAKATDMLLTLTLKDMEVAKGPDGTGGKMRAFVMGRTRAYFRAGALEFLEGERIKQLGAFASVVQRMVRGWVQRSKYGRFYQATIRLQAGFRRHVSQTSYAKVRTGLIRIQCWYRVLFAARTIVHLRRAFKSTMIQTCWRIRRDQQRYRQVRAAIIVVQSVMRGALQRPRYRRALKEKVEEAKLENQLLALQRKLEEAEARREQAEKNAEARARAVLHEHQRQRDEDVEKQQRAKELEESNRKEESMRKDEAEQPLVPHPVSDPPVGPVSDDEEEEDDGNRSVHDELQNASELEHEIQLHEEQQRLMDESGRMLEYLRKEVFKLRTQNQQLKRDFDLMKENNQRLMDANASAGASFAALNQHAKQVSKQNGQLTKEVESLKAHNHKMNIVQVELKDELKMKQASYIAEVQSRLQYQKSLQKVTDMIQERCRDHRLVEKVLQVADECEMEYMHMEQDHGRGNPNTNPLRVTSSDDGDLDDNMDEAALNSSRGLLGFFFR